MAKKYPLKKAYIYKEKKMEITFNEHELSKVIEAGLKAVGYDAGTIESMNVTQSRKTGNASLTLEVNPFGLDTTEEQLELPLEEAAKEEVVEEAESVLVSAEPVEEAKPVKEEEVAEPLVEEPVIAEDTTADEGSLFSTSTQAEPVVEEESDSLFG